MKLYLTVLGVPGITAWVGLNQVFNKQEEHNMIK